MAKRTIEVLWVLVLLLVASFGVTLSWVMLACCAYVVALAGIIVVCCSGYGKSLSKMPGVLLFVAVFYFGLRMMTSEVWDLAKEDAMLMGMGVIVYLVSRRIIISHTWILVLSLTVLVNVIYFVAQLQGVNWPVPMSFVSARASMTQNYGLFQDYGALGNSLAISGWLLICFAFWSRESRKLLRVMTGALGGISLVVMALSGSRSAILASLCGGIIVMIIGWNYAEGYLPSIREKIRRSITVSLLIGSAGLGVLGYQTFVERSTGGDIMPQKNVRLGYWGMAVDQGLENPVFGSGSRSFSYECFRHWSSSMSTMEANPEFVHNEYLQTWTDYGLVGLLLIIVLILSHLFVGLYYLLNNKPTCRQAWVIIAGIVGLIAIIVHSSTDFPQRLPWNMCLAALCLSWCCPTDDTEIKINHLNTKGRRRLVPPILLMLTVLWFAGHEVWAGWPLIRSKMVREDGAWSPEGKWPDVKQIELAAERSPDFRRYLHIGQIYHSNQDLKGGPALAIENYKKALNRNPYDVVAAIGLADLYKGGGRFDEAETIYQNIEQYASSRDWWLEYYLAWAQCKFAIAYELLSEGNPEKADQQLSDAIVLLERGTSKSVERMELIKLSYLSRLGIAVSLKKYDEVETLWEELTSSVPAWELNDRPQGLRGAVGDLYLTAAVTEWECRKPELAKKLFERSKYYYSQDRKVRRIEDKIIHDEKLQYIDTQLKILERAGF